MFSVLLIASLIGLGACALSVNNCPFGLVRNEYLQIHGTKCYKFSLDSKKDWVDAKKDCNKIGGSLAMPKTKDVNDFLVTQIKDTYKATSPVWIGLSDLDTENTFMWTDGSLLNVTTDFVNFARFEGPRKSIVQGSFEDCVAIDPMEDRLWHDYHCESEFFHLFNADKYYVCEYGMINLPTEAAPTCKPLPCDKDCGLRGLKTDDMGCVICECEN